MKGIKTQHSNINYVYSRTDVNGKFYVIVSETHHMCVCCIVAFINMMNDERKDMLD